MAIEFGGSVVLEKPVEEVWRFLTDPDRDTNWRRPHVVSSRKLTDGPLAVGSRCPSEPSILFVRLAIITVALVVFALGAMFSLFTPERGLQDRLAGTWLVPR